MAQALQAGSDNNSATIMKATFVRYSMCICGYPVLSDSVPIGTVFTVDPDNTAPMTVICGGCGKHNPVTGVWVHERNGRHAGYLPLEIFELEKEKGTE